jgi:hypothetical protein
MPVSAKKFFNRVGSGLEKGLGEFSKATGKAAGAVIGSGIAKYAVDAAPLLLFKTGGRVPGKKGKAMKAIVHGSEYILPVGVKPTASQKKAVAKNKLTERMKSGRLS